jgi:phage RecT family recombinase
MATDVAKKQKTWQEVLEENKNQFSLALPKVGLTPERVISVALTAMNQDKRGMLKKCDPRTVVASLIQACEVGLSVSNALGHAYLVPFRNNEKQIVECTLIIGYRGYLTLMKRSNEVSDIKSTIVYSQEPFEMGAGDRPFLKHTPLPPSDRGEKIIGVYTVVLFRDGTSTYEWMWYDEVMKLKARSKAASSGPWVTDTEEMIKKCPIRRIAKRMPMSAELVQKAAMIDEYNEVGIRVGDMLVEDPPEKPIEETVKPATEQKVNETPNEVRQAQKPEEPPEAKVPDEVIPPPAQEKTKDEPKKDKDTITPKQINMINALCANVGIKEENRRAVIGNDILKLGEAINSMKELTKEQASTVIKWLQEREAEMTK